MNLIKFIKKEILIAALSVIFLVLGISFVTYAVFMDIKEGSTNTITYGNLEMEFDDISGGMGDSIIRTTDIPINDVDGQNTVPYKFKVKNTGNLTTNYAIKLVQDDEYIASNNLINKLVNENDIKVSVNGETPKLYSEYINNVLYTGILNPTTEKTFQIRVWLKSDASNAAIGKHFVTLLKIEGNYIPE